MRGRGLGIRSTKRPVVLHSDSALEIAALEEVTPLREVVVEAEQDKNITGTQTGTARLDVKTIKQVPTVFGAARQPVAQTTISLRQATGQSAIELPADLPTDRCLVRAYPRWMKNADPDFYFHPPDAT